MKPTVHDSIMTALQNNGGYMSSFQISEITGLTIREVSQILKGWNNVEKEPRTLGDYAPAKWRLKT